MRPADLPALAKRLCELADYYDRKDPSAQALRIWLDVLGECSLDDVLFVLTDWPKSHRLMPMADEILKACRSRASDRYEAAAERARREAPSIASTVSRLQANPAPEAMAALGELKAWLRSGKGRVTDDPKAWARKLRDRELAGEILLDVQAKAWRKALRVEREHRGEVEA